MRRFLMGTILLLGLGSAAAQSPAPIQRLVVPREMQAPPSESAAQVAGDPVKQLQKRAVVLGKHVRTLEGRVASLEEALREMRAQTTYTCVAPARSANGAGAIEDCTPLACNYVDGRCRQSAAGTQHCAAGFVWDGSGRCVAPPPPNDEDCGFLGLACI